MGSPTGRSRMRTSAYCSAAADGSARTRRRRQQQQQQQCRAGYSTGGTSIITSTRRRCCGCLVALLLATSPPRSGPGSSGGGSSSPSSSAAKLGVSATSEHQRGAAGGHPSSFPSTPRSKTNSGSRRSALLPGRRGFPADEDEDFLANGKGFVGMGREFSLFGGTGRGGDASSGGGTGDSSSSSSSPPSSSSVDGSADDDPAYPQKPLYPGYSMSSFQKSQQKRRGGTAGGGNFGGRSYYNSGRRKKRWSNPLEPVGTWWQIHVGPTVKNWPKIQCIVEPTTTLKIRKTFRPLKTVVRLGADFNTQLGVWQFKSSWEDEIIGGKLTLAGRELQITKSWQLTGGGFGIEDLVTRLRLRAAVDLKTWKAYARVGFRTERLRPINVMEGFTILKRVPLDGNRGNVKLEVKANVALPEPEIEYSTETQRSLVGMGDIEVNIEELNLLLDY